MRVLKYFSLILLILPFSVFATNQKYQCVVGKISDDFFDTALQSGFDFYFHETKGLIDISADDKESVVLKLNRSSHLVRGTIGAWSFNRDNDTLRSKKVTNVDQEYWSYFIEKKDEAVVRINFDGFYGVGAIFAGKRNNLNFVAKFKCI